MRTIIPLISEMQDKEPFELPSFRLFISHKHGFDDPKYISKRDMIMKGYWEDLGTENVGGGMVRDVYKVLKPFNELDYNDNIIPHKAGEIMYGPEWDPT